MIGDTEDEYRRLLYVAMTRAADRLIVGGCLPGNMNNVRQVSWYDLIRKGLANSGLQLQEIETADRRGEALHAAGGCRARHRRRAAAAPTAPDRAAILAADSPRSRSDRQKACCGRPTPLRTTAIASGQPNRSRSAPARLQRGTLVHRLLQSLPDIAAARRREAALAYLARNAGGWTAEERQALAEGTLALIADARFAPVFAPGSRAEVSIVGRLERPGRPAGAGLRADRPPRGHRERGPDRRFQDQPRPAEPARRGPEGLCPPARAVPGGIGASFIPSCQSGPHCFGPKPLN